MTKPDLGNELVEAAERAFARWEYPAALRLFRELASRGCVEGQLGVYRVFSIGSDSGVILDCSEQEAVQWLSQAAAQGNAAAQYLLGWAFQEGDVGLPQDERKAVQWFLLAAQQGDVEAQIHLAEMYASGTGVTKDTGEATKWVTKAAEKGHIEAIHSLCGIYAHGRGLPKNRLRAEAICSMLAKSTSPRGKNLAALEYASGRNVKKNGMKAAQLFRDVAASGLTTGLCGLAALHEGGNGVPQDPARARELYEDAARQRSGWARRWLDASSDKFGGHPFIQYVIGLEYTWGIRIPRDEVQASTWFRRAAVRGFSWAQYQLGRRMAVGCGIGKDVVEAYTWLTLASAESTEAVRLRNLIGLTMATEDIAEAETRARAFSPIRQSAKP